jgi:hypothetical protein
MGLFKRRLRKLSYNQMAQKAFEVYKEWIRVEALLAKAHNRKKWIKKEGWDYDKKAHAEEHKYLYAFLTIETTPYVFKCYDSEFKEALKSQFKQEDTTFVFDRLSTYQKVWDDAGEKMIAGGTGGEANLAMSISSQAVLFRFGEDDTNRLQNTIMFGSTVNAFSQELGLLKKKYELIS